MRKILVIDDEKPTLSMFRLLLSACNHQVFTAENGVQGLEVYERERPPIVLTDIKMPGMDGIEVLKHIKTINPQTEVIVITGHGDMELAIQALNLDATDFVNKPIQKSELDAALQRAEERIALAGDKSKEVLLEGQGLIGVIHVQGNINSQSEPYLNAVFDEAVSRGFQAIVFNFDKNSSTNGAGIAILIQLLNQCKERNIKAALSGLTDNIKKYFDIVGITRLAPTYETVSQAEQGMLHPES